MGLALLIAGVICVCHDHWIIGIILILLALGCD